MQLTVRFKPSLYCVEKVFFGHLRHQDKIVRDVTRLRVFDFSFAFDLIGLRLGEKEVII